MINLKEQFNLNSIITIVIAFINMMMFVIGTFLWGTVTKTQDEVKKLNEGMATAVVNQNHLQRTLEDMIPKGELDLRFRAIEVEILAIKTRMQQTDAAIARLQK